MTAEPRRAARDVLARHEFFRDLPEAVLSGLSARSRRLDLPAGRVIFAKGDEGLGLLAVLRGLVQISVPSAEGREIVLNLIHPGQIFGEVALLDGLPRTADAKALRDTELLVLDRRDFLTALLHAPEAALKLLEVVSRRLRRTSEQVEALGFESPGVRLAKTLLKLAEASRSCPPRVIMTQRELGQAVGLSRESTNKHLRRWERAGAIELFQGGLTVHDVAHLASFAE
jgi:CRP/FNR family transcriptional regulator, cyclic AMP receptor protein